MSNAKDIKYVVITPVRDEALYIEKTIESVTSQTVKPVEWVIVNDGSTDDTGKIIDRYSKEYPWIHTVHRENRGFRKSGGGVIEAFYDGYDSLKSENWGFIVKLDGDLSFEGDYFEKCFERFNKDQTLGIGGGTIYHDIGGYMRPERTPVFHVRGATKIYTRECWNGIGGLIRVPGWDGIDEVKANMLGWKTMTFSDLKIAHHRYTGEADGTWRNWVKGGRANYISGYHPLFMFFKCIKRLFQKPYVLSSIGLLYGYISGYWEKVPQIDDRSLIDYLRKQQLRRLFFRKSIWK
jgi:biofilm PGA synthesis N-glycosyltransferase PgaC